MLQERLQLLVLVVELKQLLVLQMVLEQELFIHQP